LLVDSWKESCPATAEAAVDDDGGDGWRLAAGGDGGHGRGVGWGRVKIKSTVVVGARRCGRYHTTWRTNKPTGKPTKI
jgi:hypothetical protein